MMRLLMVVVALWLSSCSSSARLCSKKAECRAENDGVQLEPDSIEVCTANREAELAALRANAEEECQQYADALQALDGCQSRLTCDDFIELDLGRECQEERDRFQLAFNNVGRLRGGLLECSAAD
jgi:hypothetical protein